METAGVAVAKSGAGAARAGASKKKDAAEAPRAAAQRNHHSFLLVDVNFTKYSPPVSGGKLPVDEICATIAARFVRGRGFKQPRIIGAVAAGGPAAMQDGPEDGVEKSRDEGPAAAVVAAVPRLSAAEASAPSKTAGGGTASLEASPSDAAASPRAAEKATNEAGGAVQAVSEGKDVVAPAVAPMEAAPAAPASQVPMVVPPSAASLDEVSRGVSGGADARTALLPDDREGVVAAAGVAEVVVAVAAPVASVGDAGTSIALQSPSDAAAVGAAQVVTAAAVPGTSAVAGALETVPAVAALATSAAVAVPDSAGAVVAVPDASLSVVVASKRVSGGTSDGQPPRPRSAFGGAAGSDTLPRVSAASAVPASGAIPATVAEAGPMDVTAVTEPEGADPPAVVAYGGRESLAHDATTGDGFAVPVARAAGRDGAAKPGPLVPEDTDVGRSWRLPRWWLRIRADPAGAAAARGEAAEASTRGRGWGWGLASSDVAYYSKLGDALTGAGCTPL